MSTPTAVKHENNENKIGKYYSRSIDRSRYYATALDLARTNNTFVGTVCAEPTTKDDEKNTETGALRESPTMRPTDDPG